GGQWGLGTRFIIDSWNSAELGFYWVRSHSFIPYLQADFDPNGVGPLAPLSALGLGPVSYKRVFAEDQNTYAISLGGELGTTGLSYGLEINLRENFIDTRQCMNNFGLTGVAAGLGVLGGGGSLAAAQGTAQALSPQVAGCDVGESDTWMLLGNIVKSGGGGPFGANRQSYVFDG